MSSYEESNDRLRAALAEAGLTHEQFADLVRVDERTVRRWLTGLTPRPRHRIKVAEALGKDERELWPHAIPELDQQEEERRDRVAVYSSATDQGLPDWRTLLEHATQQIEIYDWSAAGLLAHPGVSGVLAAKAAAGTGVRILIASLETLWLAADDLEPAPDRARSPYGRPLAHTVEQAHDHLWPLTQQQHIPVLQVLAPRSPSILRFDDHMLAALHLWDSIGPGPLILHLQRRSDYGQFAKLCAHFNALWAQGWPLDQSHRELEDAHEEPPGHADPGPSNPAGDGNDRSWRRRAVLAPYGRRPPRRRP